MLAGLHANCQWHLVCDQLAAAIHPAAPRPPITIAIVAGPSVRLLLVALLLVAQFLQQAQGGGSSAQHAAAHAAAARQRRQEHLGGGSSQPRHAYVAACVLAKDEHLNIREWILYHKWIGINKFYVFDHQSKPPLADVLQVGAPVVPFLGARLLCAAVQWAVTAP